MYTVSITSQGQISIPAPIMRMINLRKNHKALVSIKEGKIMVEPVGDILALKGSLRTTKRRLSGRKLHDLFAAASIKGR